MALVVVQKGDGGRNIVDPQDGTNAWLDGVADQVGVERRKTHVIVRPAGVVFVTDRAGFLFCALLQ